MNVYTNKNILIDNWYEDKYGTFPSKNEGNRESTYQKDYRESVFPIRDNRVMRNIRERAMVILLLQSICWRVLYFTHKSRFKKIENIY